MKGFGVPSREYAEAILNVSAVAKAYMNFIPCDREYGAFPQAQRHSQPGEADNSPDLKGGIMLEGDIFTNENVTEIRPEDIRSIPKRNERISVPHWLAWTVAGIVTALIGASWWLSLSSYGGNCYELGKQVERRQNPARQYIEDGTPFLWYKGTYYRVQYVRPKVFRVLE